MNTARDLYLKGKSLLEGLENPEIEARLLVHKAVSVTAEDFFSDPDRRIAPVEERIFLDMLEKRLSGIPLAYITGKLNNRKAWPKVSSIRAILRKR